MFSDNSVTNSKQKVECCVFHCINEDNLISKYNRFRFMVFNTTFNNISVISWWSVLLMEETGENHQPAASH